MTQGLQDAAASAPVSRAPSSPPSLTAWSGPHAANARTTQAATYCRRIHARYTTARATGERCSPVTITTRAASSFSVRHSLGLELGVRLVLRAAAVDRVHDAVERARELGRREQSRPDLGHHFRIVAEGAAAPGAEHQASMPAVGGNREHLGRAGLERRADARACVGVAREHGA